MKDSIEKWLYDPVMGKVVAALLAIIIIVIIMRLIRRLAGKYIQETNIRYRVRKFITFIGYFLVIIALMTIFSDRLGGLNIALGLAGAGIAFALQEVITSIAGWFAIIFSSFFKTGDRISLGGVKGDVIDIGVLRTTVMEIGEWVDGDLYNGRVVRVANSFVFKEPVFNYSGEFPFLWDEITLPIRYGSDFKFAHELLHKITVELVGEYSGFAQKSWDGMVKKFNIENAQVEPLVTMTANENWMTFTIRYVVDFKNRRKTKDRLFMRFLDEIERTDGRISIAGTSMDINLYNPKASDSDQGHPKK